MTKGLRSRRSCFRTAPLLLAHVVLATLSA